MTTWCMEIEPTLVMQTLQRRRKEDNQEVKRGGGLLVKRRSSGDIREGFGTTDYSEV